MRVLPEPVVDAIRRLKGRTLLEMERFGPLQRRLNRNIVVHGLPRRRRVPGSVWAVCMARNEEDIIGHSVRHMLTQGVAGVIVVDNLSSDGTRKVLDEIAAEDPRLHVGVDSEPGFHQGMKTSYLAHLAWRAGADWVVPFDADEFWYASNDTLAGYLGPLPVEQVWCDFRHVYPLAEDGRLEPGSGRSVQVDRASSPWLKIAFRARRWVWVGEGNHALRISRSEPVRGLHQLHFPYRSLEQYSRKAHVGVTALDAAGKDTSIATHWRGWANLSDEERSEQWTQYLEGRESALDLTVRGERLVIAEPLNWRTWDPEGQLIDES